MKVISTELQGNDGLMAKVFPNEKNETLFHPLQIAVLDKEVALTRKEAWQFIAQVINALRQTA